MCIKLSTGSSTDDWHTDNNLPSKDTAATFQKYLTIYLETLHLLGIWTKPGMSFNQVFETEYIIGGKCGSINFCIITWILIQENRH